MREERDRQGKGQKDRRNLYLMHEGGELFATYIRYSVLLDEMERKLTVLSIVVFHITNLIFEYL